MLGLEISAFSGRRTDKKRRFLSAVDIKGRQKLLVGRQLCVPNRESVCKKKRTGLSSRAF